jgi:hypothetical protein
VIQPTPRFSPVGKHNPDRQGYHPFAKGKMESAASV